MCFISIIIPNFNNEKYLDDCLSPFLEIKNKKDVEVIIVDDKSTDNSLSLIQKYVDLDSSLFKLVAKDTNNHHGSALNAGIKVAKGKWLSFLDADDYYNSTEFDKAFEYLITTKGDTVSFGVNIFFDQVVPIKIKENEMRRNALEFYDYCFVPIMGSFYKRELATDLIIPEGYMFDDIYSDSYFWNKAKLVDYNRKIKLFNYRLNRPGQSVGDMDANYYNSLRIHVYMAYKCITEIEEDYYLRWHNNATIKYFLTLCGCPPKYFENEKKLISFFKYNIDPINSEVNQEIVAKNIVKYNNFAISPDLDINRTKLIDYNFAWSNIK